jgi:hypothetical protein
MSLIDRIVPPVYTLEVLSDCPILAMMASTYEDQDDGKSSNPQQGHSEHYDH